MSRSTNTTLSAPRERLIRIQRTLVRRLRDEIHGSLEDPSPDLRAYQREYFRSFRGSARRRIGPAAFLERLSRADLIFQGEYHTLSACQEAALWILRGISRRRRVVLCTEAVPIEGQLALDAYLARECGEEELLEAIDHAAPWGFTWTSYAPIFRFAREEEVQVYGLSSPPGGGDENIRSRDERAAEVIARAAASHPDALVYVIAGDFRVCRLHLPRAVEARFEREGLSGRSAIVHQNVDCLYWGLAGGREAREPAILDLGRGELCIMSSTPLVKYQSYLHWQLEQEELPCAGFGAGTGESPGSLEVARAVHALVRAIARFLRVDAAGLDDFTVYTTRDLDFLSDLERRWRYSPREVGEVARQILNDESYFLSRGNIIYLSSLSVEHAAEEAAHYMNNKLSGHVPGPLPARTDFYARAMKEALGFLGSKVVNPRRFAHREEDFREILSRASRDGVEARLEPLVELSRFVIQHLDMERRRARRGWKRSRLRAIYSTGLDLHLGITHSLGYILGEKLHRGIVSGRIERSAVRELFHAPFSGRDEAERAYFDLVSQLE